MLTDPEGARKIASLYSAKNHKKSEAFYWKFQAVAALLKPVLLAGIKPDVESNIRFRRGYKPILSHILEKTFASEIKKYGIKKEAWAKQKNLGGHIAEGEKLINSLPGWGSASQLLPPGLILSVDPPNTPVALFLWNVGRALIYPDQLLNEVQKAIRQVIFRAYSNISNCPL